MLQTVVEYQTNPFSRKTRSKQPVLVKNIDDINKIKIYKKDNIWISATEFDNFCNKDKFSDWLNALKNHYEIDEEDEHSIFIKFLFKKGFEYEEKVVNSLREKLQLPLEKHSSLATSRLYKDNKMAIKDMSTVLESMKRGDPIIYSGFIFDEKSRLRGIPDFLVRNDSISLIFPNILNFPAQESLFGNYYYLPVEIKFSTLHLNKSSKYFLNQDRLKIYKTQLFTYCKILESIQGYFPSRCFIIGKQVKDGKDVYDPFKHTGMVDFSTFDKDTEKIFSEGYDWLCNVKTKFLNWNVFDMPEIFPNMKVEHPILSYNKIKKSIASSLNDITEIWQCSDTHRQNAIKNGIYSWDDPNLTSSILGVYEKHAPTVDQILKTNRGELGQYYPPCFLKNTHDFKNISIEGEMFVDFETIISIEESRSEHSEHSEFIFLVGVWYQNEYYRFLVNELTKDEETRILNEFYVFWENMNKPKLWYWYAETEMWKRAIKRNGMNGLDISFYDLYDVYQQEPFTVKGCKNFKLKSYIKALYNLGKIEAEFPPSCDNGLDAMMIAYHYYTEKKQDLTEKFNDMIQYNRLDCKYLQTLLDFARSIS